MNNLVKALRWIAVFPTAVLVFILAGAVLNSSLIHTLIEYGGPLEYLYLIKIGDWVAAPAIIGAIAIGIAAYYAVSVISKIAPVEDARSIGIVRFVIGVLLLIIAIGAFVAYVVMFGADVQVINLSIYLVATIVGVGAGIFGDE